MTEYKGYRILSIPNLIGYELQHIGRGSIHNSISGHFTSVKIAKDSIDNYLKTKEGKEDVDVENNTDSGDQQIQRRSYNRRKSSN